MATMETNQPGTYAVTNPELRHVTALEPVHKLAAGPCTAEDVVDAVAALRQAQKQSRNYERTLMAMAVHPTAHGVRFDQPMSCDTAQTRANDRPTPTVQGQNTV